MSLRNGLGALAVAFGLLAAFPGTEALAAQGGASRAPILSGATARSRIIGSVRGDADGTAISGRMETHASQLEAELPDGFRVDRIGEGILVVGPAHRGGSAGWNLAVAALGRLLDGNPGVHAFIVAHSREQADGPADMRESHRLAEAVRKFLTIGWSEDQMGRVTATGQGRSEPIASNETPLGRQRNTRVEIALYVPAE